VVDSVREFISQVEASNRGEVRQLQVLVHVSQLHSEVLDVETRRDVHHERRARETHHQDPFELQRGGKSSGLGVGTANDDDLGGRDDGDVLREEGEGGDFGCGFVSRTDRRARRREGDSELASQTQRWRRSC